MQPNDVIIAVSHSLRRANILLLSLVILHITPLASTNPVSLPEIVSKSGKNAAGSTATATLVIKPSPQDAQLNSLNAYATNYDHFTSQFANNAAQTVQANPNISPTNSNINGNNNGNINMNVNNFKPSYKLPEVENNFKPIQTYGSVNNQIPNATPLTTIAATNANNMMTNSNNVPQPTPVLMQYLPHTIPENGVHYLQLIPTRPLIVPISPFLNGNGPTTATHNTINAAPHALHPPLAAAINGGPLEYGVRAPAILASEPINSAVTIQQQHQHQHQHQQNAPPTATLIDISNGATSPYGLHTYANAIQPYRSSYRINREVKGKHFPGTMMTLNMNEYIPGPNEALRPLYMRGRP
ncbi:serine/threonine-protein kinase atg1 isoform X2 [Ceratitis capitata]|nr:serine/threonine-protein kinase atg1 isoform X2 [Ceratitis capitata]